MKLTQIQIEIIEHRLEVPDAIYDACVSAIEAIEPTATAADFDAAVKHVAEMITGDFDTLAFTNIEWLVFEDSIEGSTLADVAQDAVGYPIDAGGISQQKANAYNQASEYLYDTFVGGRS